MKVVILAGGIGSRLGLRDRPKPMISVAGKPLLERHLEVATASGFNDFIFLNGHLSEVIEDYFGNGSRHGVRIMHVREPAPLGTAGAVKNARQFLTEPFLLLYGDILMDVDLRHFEEFYRIKGGLGALFVHPNDHPFDSDLVEVDRDAQICNFISKPHAPGALLPNLVSAGLYVLHPNAIDFVPENRPSDWGMEIFPAVLRAGRQLFAYRSVEYAKDIGTLHRLKIGLSDLDTGRVSRLSRRNAKPAIFFDRDGVLNEEVDGVHRPEDLVLREGVGEAVRTVNRWGIPAICVTNQPDVAKGNLTLGMLSKIFAALDTALARHNAYLDAVYYCPHHPERGWPGEIEELKIDCSCRKPAPGLLLMAARDHIIDLSRSWMIGDRGTDMTAAHAAGAKGILVEPIRGQLQQGQRADFVARDVPEAVRHALAY